MKPVPYEIRFVAFTKMGDGISVYDIVDTSYHYASWFYRRYSKDPGVCAIEIRTRNNVVSRRVEFPR